MKKSSIRTSIVSFVAFGFASLVSIPAFSADLVISQVYGGGGNSGATHTHDFIELFNRGSSPINLNGYSVQYASSTGTSWTNKRKS